MLSSVGGHLLLPLSEPVHLRWGGVICRGYGGGAGCSPSGSRCRSAQLPGWGRAQLQVVAGPTCGLHPWGDSGMAMVVHGSRGRSAVEAGKAGGVPAAAVEAVEA